MLFVLSTWPANTYSIILNIFTSEKKEEALCSTRMVHKNMLSKNGALY